MSDNDWLGMAPIYLTVIFDGNESILILHSCQYFSDSTGPAMVKNTVSRIFSRTDRKYSRFFLGEILETKRQLRWPCFFSMICSGGCEKLGKSLICSICTFLPKM